MTTTITEDGTMAERRCVSIDGVMGERRTACPSC